MSDAKLLAAAISASGLAPATFWRVCLGKRATNNVYPTLAGKRPLSDEARVICTAVVSDPACVGLFAGATDVLSEPQREQAMTIKHHTPNEVVEVFDQGDSMARRTAWVVVYCRRGENMPTLREMYWSKESAEERAADLGPHCREILVGLMAWYKDPHRSPT